ncbi:MAG: hypothetical protein LBG52_03955 [Candidatus Peribacteria bacterium]|jgi:hypothetical protein|nr:hypothetical protein [Candidatus Peribacteria bacterium]
MTQRMLPPKLKLYEALGALADERVELDGLLMDQGKVHSASTPGRVYEIHYNSSTNVIASDDSGSLHQGYLGYPAIAFLLKIGKLPYNPRFLLRLRGIDRNDIKQKVHKHHEETLRLLLGTLFQQGYEVDELVNEVEKLYGELESLKLLISVA